MSDALTLLYTHIALYILVLRLHDVLFLFLFIYLFIFANHFFGKKIAPPLPLLFVTELHNYGCADISSLNEMLILAPGTNIHTCFDPSLLLVFGFIFYERRRNKLHRSHFLAFCHITFRKSKLNIFICNTSSSRNDSEHNIIWSLTNYFQIKETIFIILSEVYILS